MGNAIGIAALVLTGIGVYYTIRQYQIMRRQQVLSAPPVTSVEIAEQTSALEPTPRFITQAEFDTRVKAFRTQYEFKGPTPERAQQYLQEGWERDEIDGHPLVMGGTLQRADNWIVRRRPVVFGLSDATIAALVAMRRNTYHQNSFQYVSGGSRPHLITSLCQWNDDEATLIREQLLDKTLAVKEPQEDDRYTLTELGRNEADRLILLGASVSSRRITWI